MDLIEKEHLLHKILAGSAFVFALALLPIAHYFFTETTSAQTGVVAGVSTERPGTDASATASALPTFTSAAACAEYKSQQISAEQALLNDTWLPAYNTAVGNGEDVTVATKKYDAEQAAVASAENTISTIPCPAD